MDAVAGSRNVRGPQAARVLDTAHSSDSRGLRGAEGESGGARRAEALRRCPAGFLPPHGVRGARGRIGSTNLTRRGTRPFSADG